MESSSIVTLNNIPASLNSEVTDLLKLKLADNGTVTTCGQHVLICLKKADIEERLGIILQQIYRIIEQHFPIRAEHVSLIIRDIDMHYKNTFKIWKSA